LAYKKQIKLEFSSPEESKIMAADKEILERIILNLASNSIKYCDKGSHVLISAWQEFEFMYISVKDNGNGIEKSKLDSIFKRRVASYSKDNIPTGSGIGLNIVKEFTGLLNGEVTLNTGSTGTEVIIKLPCFKVKEGPLKNNFLDDFYSYNIFEIELSDDYNIK
jgi:signal transduction histidine kinase